jgi:hypothetical protein
MVPTFIRVTSTLKGLIENEINQGKSNINLTPYISKTTLDIIGLVGERKKQINEIFFNIYALKN